MNLQTFFSAITLVLLNGCAAAQQSAFPSWSQEKFLDTPTPLSFLRMSTPEICGWLDSKVGSLKGLQNADAELRRRSATCRLNLAQQPTNLTTTPRASQGSPQEKFLDTPTPLTFSQMSTKEVCSWLDSKVGSLKGLQNADAELRRRSATCSSNSIQQATQTAPQQNTSVASRSAQATQSTLSIAANASSPDSNGVVTLNITTNSDTASLKINGDEAGGRTDGRYSINRFAQIGSNSYEVVATDRFGNSSKQTVVVNREIQVVAERTRSLNPTLISAAKPRDAVAIIIGVEKYKSIPDADFANRDASVFYDYARRALGIKPENISLLVDDKANSVAILRAFKTWLPARVNKNTTDVYVFYSGHGLPSEDGDSLYFLPHEVERDLLERTAINQKEVIQTIQRASPKSVTMFIDSCYSGQSRTGTSLLASARPISIAPKASTDFPSNFMVISASAPDQISSSSPELKHGIFSYYLMLGMEGEADVNKDGQITVGEMQTYLSQQVTRRAIGMNRTQSPQTTGDLNRVLVQANSKMR
jgi:hypothetical protein